MIDSLTKKEEALTADLRGAETELEVAITKIKQLMNALSEWPIDWDARGSGREHYQVDYTVAKARRMAKVWDSANAFCARHGVALLPGEA